MTGVRVIVLGRQGSGKGTQCARLAAHLGVPHVSTGDLFRAAVADGTDLGRRVKTYLDDGVLVPDALVLDVVADRLSRPDVVAHGFLLDGFPRTVAQGRALLDHLGPDGLDAAIEIDVAVASVRRRLLVRRVCRGCGRNEIAPEPDVDRWTCAACGEVVARRSDDTPAAIERRLATYDEETGPLLVWLHSRGVLVPVDGEGSPDEVFRRLIAALDARVPLDLAALG